jgi:micrococcal nuclease
MWTYKAKIIKIVDADTLDLDIDLGFGILKRERIRLARVDAWEVRGEERPQGLLAKDAVIALAEQHGHECTVTTSKDKGKYGRYIGEIDFHSHVIGETSINLSDYLLEEGHATLYN